MKSHFDVSDFSKTEAISEVSLETTMEGVIPYFIDSDEQVLHIDWF